MILESFDGFFQQGSSDKEYHIQLNKQNETLYNVEAQWGRRGSALESQVKTIADNLISAQKVYNKIKREKLGKGYIEQIPPEGQVRLYDASPANDNGVFPSPAPVTPVPATTINVVRRRILWEPDPNDPHQPVPRTAPSPQPSPVPATGKIQTGIQAQLLNEIMDVTSLHDYLYDDEWVMQEKMDGKKILVKWDAFSRAITTINKKGEQILSSPSFINNIRPQLEGKSSMLLDGEQIGDKFFVYDLLEYAGNDLRPKPYGQRFNILMTQFLLINSDRGIIRVPLYTGADKRLKFEEFKAQNKEGVVFKRLSAVFTASKAHQDMWKFKFVASCSCRVSHRETGKQSVGLELLIPGAPGAWVDVGNVTTIGKGISTATHTHTVVEVLYLYAYRGGCLFQPRVIGIRDDIDESECTTAQLKYKAGT
jgi:bifunctional non-homologous end joining protein LigD